MNIKKYSLLLLMCVQAIGLSALKPEAFKSMRGCLPLKEVKGQLTKEELIADFAKMSPAEQKQKFSKLTPTQQQQIIQYCQKRQSGGPVDIFAKVAKQIFGGTIEASASRLANIGMEYLVVKGATLAMSASGLYTPKNELPAGQSKEYYLNAAHALANPPSTFQVCNNVVQSVVKGAAISVVTQTLLGAMQLGVFGRQII